MVANQPVALPRPGLLECLAFERFHLCLQFVCQCFWPLPIRLNRFTVKGLSMSTGGRANTVTESTSNLSSLVRTNSFELDCACFESSVKTYAYPRCKTVKECVRISRF